MGVQRIRFCAEPGTAGTGPRFLLRPDVDPWAVTMTASGESPAFPWTADVDKCWRFVPQSSMEVVLVQAEASTAATDRPDPTESDFRRLATESPLRLVWLLRYGGLRPAQLTFAAEIAGGIPQPDVVVPALVELLSHPSPVVREGAVYGLGKHLTDEVRLRLAAVSEQDSSPAVRAAAHDALE
jgi:hypothetical protein